LLTARRLLVFPFTAGRLLFIGEIVSIQAGRHLLFRHGLKVLDVEALGSQNGLHVGGDELVVELGCN
jgi:hypothetical protein